MPFDDEIRRELRYARSQLEGAVRVPNELPLKSQRRPTLWIVAAASLALAGTTLAVVRVRTLDGPPGERSFVGEVPPSAPGAPGTVQETSTARPREQGQGELVTSPSATPSPGGNQIPFAECEVGPRDLVASPTQVSVEIASLPDRAEQGGTVTLRLRVRNNGLTPVEYEHGGREFDLLVFDDTGEPVWTWGHGRAFELYQAEATIMPQEEVVFEERWDLNRCGGQAGESAVEPGEYTVQGYFVAGNDENWWSPPTTLTIESST